MTGKVFHQVIFCSDPVMPERSAFLRETLVTGSMGKILDNRKMFPHYHMVMENLREQYETILALPPDFRVEGDSSCPYCGNSHLFLCNCGYLSCFNSDKKNHICPCCKSIFTSFKRGTWLASQSGFVHGDEQRIPRYSGNNNNRQIESEYKIGDTYRRVTAYLEKRLLPNAASSRKNKALPSSDTKKLPWKKD